MKYNKTPIKVGIIANAKHARNFYKIIGTWVTMKVIGVYEVDFVEIYGLKNYRQMIFESPEEVILKSDILIVHSNDSEFNQKMIQIAFDNNLSVITSGLPMFRA